MTNLTTHILGYPRIGAKRELKFALESYWQASSSQAELISAAQAVEAANWQAQVTAGVSLLTVGDFVYYDHILTHAVRLGVLPKRFTAGQALNSLDRQFYLARGRAPNCPDVAALEMTKWFDTNYHYLVPELTHDQHFKADFSDLLAQVERAQAFGKPLKVVVTGLLSFLYLSRIVDQHSTLSSHQHDTDCQHAAQLKTCDAALGLVDALLPAYSLLFDQLAAAGVSYVQVDEPILALDLSQAWQAAFESVYNRLQRRDALKLIVSSYFGSLEDNLNLAVHLPVAGLHIDITREAPNQRFWQQVIDALPTHKILSLGIINGRSVWATDLVAAVQIVDAAQTQLGACAALGDRLWLATGCSLLHVPVDLAQEQLPAAIEGKLAFAQQKLAELVALASGQISVNPQLNLAAQSEFSVTAQQRSEPFTTRYNAQHARLNLPFLPTTTIGSFPQTAEIRAARAAWHHGTLSDADYQQAMQAEIKYAIEQQERLGLDVLVHGEAERTDMVEYFAGLLDGFWLSKLGWVQSYGSRCVRPPIIVGDIQRPQVMTVKWIEYANSLTDKYVKGMLTGPVTMLNWSFPPAHRSRREVALQLAEAIRLEVGDLQDAGIAIIQIDEAAFREGLPLRKAAQAEYWDWAVTAFKHCASSARVDTQIHTHMCYSEFTDCLPQIKAMDADVITIETSRSGLQLLEVFHQQGYPNAVGPGVYDIHSPRTPNAAHMKVVIDEALQSIPVERLWINPDCGLKTRHWAETRLALTEMVSAARQLRQQHADTKQPPPVLRQQISAI